MLPILRFLIWVIPVSLLGQQQDSFYIKTVDSLVIVSRAHSLSKDFKKAFEVNEIAEKMAIEHCGPESSSYGRACFTRGRIYHNQRDLSAAEKCYLSTKSIWEKSSGKNSADYASCLNNLGVLYMDMGKYSLAEPYFLEALGIREQVLGKKNMDYIFTLNNLANTYMELGSYKTAVTYNLDAMAIVEQYLGKETSDYAISMNNLGLCYLKMGDFEKADSALSEAANIRARVLGTEHPDYASSLNNRANLYLNQGFYEKAEPLCIGAKDIRGKVLGKTHQRYAWSVNNLGNLYMQMGNYEKAEALLMEALDIKEKVVGKMHPDYAMSLTNLGTLYTGMKNMDRAEALLLEACTIRSTVLGKEHSEYATALENLATLYTTTGNYRKAEQLLLESTIIVEKVLGPNHQETISNYANLGSLYYLMGDFDKAALYLWESKDLLEKNDGSAHPYYGRNLHNLANLLRDKGEWAQAIEFYQKSRLVFSTSLGKEHPEYASVTGDLSRCYWLSGDQAAALSTLKEADDLNKKYLINASRHLSEQELSVFAESFKPHLSKTFSYSRQDPKQTGACYDDILFYKGFLLNIVSQINHLSAQNPVAAGYYEQLKGCHRLLAKEYAKPLAEQKKVEELENKANNLEKELSRSVADIGEVFRQVNWREVQQALQPGEAAVEFIHYQLQTPRQPDTTEYAALVLLAGTSEPVFVPLFLSGQLEKLLEPGTRSKTELANQLYAPGKENILSGLIWQKLIPHLKNNPVVYYAPDGLLHRINIGAVGPNDPTAGTTPFKFIRLGSTRQLVIRRDGPVSSNYTAMLFGNINYEQDSTTENAAHAGLRDSPNETKSWTSLPWTAVEVNTTNIILSESGFKSRVYEEHQASEEVIRQIGEHADSPLILHVATHGFFFSDQEKYRDNTQQTAAVFKYAQSPMMRSGLVLAGANYAWQYGRSAQPEKEDGILTAYEISQINLRNTELVVLSACETGLGDIVGNEGVYGLQRAVKTAGARYLIMSLWQVPDFQTQEFMTTFYSNWLEQKMEIPEAFQNAQNTIRARYKEPFFWAGFVLME